MNYKMTGRFFAQILSVEGFFMLPPILIGFCLGETNAALSFVWTFLIISALCTLLFFLCKGAPSVFRAKDGLVCVGLGWILMSLFGALPFLFSGAIPKVVDAWFETVSGFTTTGASILSEVECLPKCILYWRSFTHWLGGMGVLVFLLLFTNEKGQGFTMHLLRAESPGPNVSKLVPKMHQTAAILYGIYIVLTILNVFFLLLGGMPLFEAVCHAFGTAGTGGFGVKNDSFTSYSSYLQVVTTVFMFLFGMNFSCYYLLLLRQFRSFFRDEEIRFYILCTLTAIGLIAVNLSGTYETFGETLRHAAFQTISIMTTTGYATADFDLWPTLSKTILLMLMIIGACAGSTGGGLKVGRVLMLFKSLHRSIRQIMHPKRVMAIQVNNETISEPLVRRTNVYLVAYMIILFVSLLLISVDGFSVETNFSAVLACFNNIGPGLHFVGPTSNYSAFSAFSKIVLSVDMLAGRLEIFPILIFVSPNMWKNV